MKKRLSKVVSLCLAAALTAGLAGCSLLILRMGSFMDTSFDQLFLMVNDVNRSVGEVFDTFIYTQGISNGKFSYTTAVGIFKSLVSMIMVVSCNWVAKKLGNEGIM